LVGDAKKESDEDLLDELFPKWYCNVYRGIFRDFLFMALIYRQERDRGIVPDKTR
jgi:hypothetical protein